MPESPTRQAASVTREFAFANPATFNGCISFDFANDKKVTD